MLTARQLPAVDYASLKTAQRALRKAIGTQIDAAAATRVGQQTISSYESTDERHGEDYTPADVIADLEAECGQPIMTRRLAELSGHVLVPLPETLGGTDRLDRITSQVLKEMADVLNRVADARADGRIDEKDKAETRKEIRDVMAVLALLDLQIQAEGSTP